MTPRLCPLIVAIAAGCTPEPKGPAQGADLVVPPMPEAGSPARARPKTAEVEEPHPSYEQAVAQALEEAPTSDRPTEPEMTDAELSAPMRNASFVSGCGAPDSMKVTVKVAVRRGRAAGVSVYTTPANGTVARCVDEHVRSLRWPDKPKLDTFTTTY